MDKDRLNEIVVSHGKWLIDDPRGHRADLCGANLRGVNLHDANLRHVILCGANLSDVNLCNANLRGANLCNASLRGADLCDTNLYNTDLRGADLRGANLRGADLRGANLRDVSLSRADLRDADLTGTKNMVKIMGVEPGNHYWKAIGDSLCNNNYRFKLGLNELPEGEVFADDDRGMCSYPGFHFSSKSWCKINYGERKYLCKIRIPENAIVNEPWATDGKASADKIEIVQILLMATEEDVTGEFTKK